MPMPGGPDPFSLPLLPQGDMPGNQAMPPMPPMPPMPGEMAPSQPAPSFPDMSAQMMPPLPPPPSPPRAPESQQDQQDQKDQSNPDAGVPQDAPMPAFPSLDKPPKQNQSPQQNAQNQSKQPTQPNQVPAPAQNSSNPVPGSVKQQVVERLKQSNNVLVTVAQNPSIDQLSAAIGLTLMMSKLGKHATTVFSGEVPNMLEFLEPEKSIEKNTDSLQDFIIALDKSKADKLRYKVEDKVVKIFITPYRTSISQNDLNFSQGDFNVDVVVALGVHNNDELDEALKAHGRILHDATVVTVMSGTDVSSIGSINWNEANASSLSEMLVSISESFKNGLLDPQMSTAFLTGIVSETERFSNAKTTPKVMTMSAQLMAAGANQQLIATKLETPEPEPEPEPEPVPAPAPEPAPTPEVAPEMSLPSPATDESANPKPDEAGDKPNTEAPMPASDFPPITLPAPDAPKAPELSKPLEASVADALPVPVAAKPRPKPPENTNVAGLISIDHTDDINNEDGAGDDALGYNMHDDSGVSLPDIHIDDRGNLQLMDDSSTDQSFDGGTVEPPKQAEPPKTPDLASLSEAPKSPEAPVQAPKELEQPPKKSIFDFPKITIPGSGKSENKFELSAAKNKKADTSKDGDAATDGKPKEEHVGMKVIKPLSSDKEIHEHTGLSSLISTAPQLGSKLTGSTDEGEYEAPTDPLSPAAPSGPMLSHGGPSAATPPPPPGPPPMMPGFNGFGGAPTAPNPTTGVVPPPAV